MKYGHGSWSSILGDFLLSPHSWWFALAFFSTTAFTDFLAPAGAPTNYFPQRVPPA